jgi:hypothetical protein
MTSFFRDVLKIRKLVIKEYVIRSAFKKSGVWPRSQKQRLRQYAKKKSTTLKEPNEPTLPSMALGSYFEYKVAAQAIIERIPDAQ